MVLEKNLNKLVSLPYQVGHEFRRKLYDCGLLHSHKLKGYVISVGNISFGGTGKTPFVIELAKYLATEFGRVCILTRGYKATKKDFPIIIDNQKAFTYQYISHQDVGDEAYMMVEKLKNFQKQILIGVDPNRTRAGRLVEKQYGPTIFILDDGLQHLALKRDVDIVLINQNEKGFYREFEQNIKKADFVIRTNVGENFETEEGTFKMVSTVELSQEPDPAKDFCIFTGIGDPETFYNQILTYLQEKNFLSPETRVEKQFYPDHHLFTEAEVTRVTSLGINIICSAKDAVKLPERVRKNHFLVAEKNIVIVPSGLYTMIGKGVADATTTSR